MIKFPEGFLWGAATSAHQVEGNNENNDWSRWEKTSGLKELSGPACRHYELYKEDFDMVRSLGHNCHRLSIEWSRIEPEEGKFLQREIDHYIDVINQLKARNIEPIVTLHHFTNPLWFTAIGGWENKDASAYFSRYVEKIVSVLCDKVHYWVTINEPTVYAYYSYLIAKWPPQEKSFSKYKKVVDNFAFAHIESYKMIHKIYKDRKLPSPAVSIAQYIRSFVPHKYNLKNMFAAYLKSHIFNHSLIMKLARAHSLDFLGVNYYSRDLIDVRSWNMSSILFDTYKGELPETKKNSMGWDIYPEGLLSNLLELKRYHLPVFILENGICTDNDSERWDFISSHLKKLHEAMEHGVNVLGYTYWSLIDNYEWSEGYSPRFGLIEVDYNTFKRTSRESAKKFSQVCKTGILE